MSDATDDEEEDKNDANDNEMAALIKFRLTIHMLTQ